MTGKIDKWQAVTGWVQKSIAYDFVRAIVIPKKNGLPDLDRCWRLRSGICLDIASLTVGMLREVGVPAYLVFGWADKNYHAWVEATINGKTYRFDHDDPSHKIRAYKKARCFG
jgi:transglutaminase-like putative cysteine protease